MKCVFVLIFAFTLGTFGARILPLNCVEVEILELLTKWRDGGISALPSLDTIKIPSVDGTYDGYGIKITYTTGEMHLAGVNNFVVEELSVNAKDLKASTTVQFPQLDLTAESYYLKGRAYMMYPLKGSGFMKATLQNVKVTVGTRLLSNGNVMYIKDIDLSFSIGSIQVDLQDSSWPINKVLNSSALKIVESYRSVIVTAAKDAMTQIFNEYLATVSSAKLIDIASKDFCKSSLETAVLALA